MTTFPRARILLSLSRTTRVYSTARQPLAYLNYDSPSLSAAKGVTFLTMNRPEAKNAINSQMLDEFAESIETVRDDG